MSFGSTPTAAHDWSFLLFIDFFSSGAAQMTIMAMLMQQE